MQKPVATAACMRKDAVMHRLPGGAADRTAMTGHLPCLADSLADGMGLHWLAPAVQMAAAASGSWPLSPESHPMGWTCFPRVATRTPTRCATRCQNPAKHGPGLRSGSACCSPGRGCCARSPTPAAEPRCRNTPACSPRPAADSTSSARSPTRGATPHPVTPGRSCGPCSRPVGPQLTRTRGIVPAHRGCLQPGHQQGPLHQPSHHRAPCRAHPRQTRSDQPHRRRGLRLDPRPDFLSQAGREYPSANMPRLSAGRDQYGRKDTRGARLRAAH
jgi:hypothetical protein